jgi:hypothetical protein
MSSKIIKNPLQAAQSNSGEFFTNYYLREWGIVRTIHRHIKQNTCGELCSLRFTMQKSKKKASDEEAFLYETFAVFVDVAWYLAGAELKNLHVEKVEGENNLFALAEFENNVVAEFEINECLPNTMPDTHFVKANFSNGHITNQPLVGHFNEEGIVIASDEIMETGIVENPEWSDIHDEMEIAKLIVEKRIENNDWPAGTLNSKAIIEAIRKAVL